MNDNQDKILADFKNPSTQATWRVVNDEVMGGISRSRMDLGEGFATFSGTVSLENNGGFASVRSPLVEADLAGYQGFRLRVKGDGKVYKFRVRTDEGFDGVAYSADFATQAGQWETITLPVTQFVPTFRGRIVRGAPALELEDVRQLGFLISDGQDGPFRLDLAEITAYP